MLRNVYSILKKNLSNNKIVFLLGPRQVGKTTMLKQIFAEVTEGKKLFLNLEVLDYHQYFDSFTSILTLLLQNGYKNGERFFLFLDEFHKVKNIDWILKSLYDEHNTIKIFVSGSNNIQINNKIKESFAGRKRVIYMHPLSFQEFIIRKEFTSETDRKQAFQYSELFIKNPLNKAKVSNYLHDFMIWGGYPEVVLAETQAEKQQIFEDIFSFRFNKDILTEVKDIYKFNMFFKQLILNNGNMLNFNKIAESTGLNRQTVERYFYLVQKSLLVYPVYPYCSNKLKEVTKMPKVYFIDTGLVNFIKKQYVFSANEQGMLFESFIFTEFLKQGMYYENIKYRRTKSGTHEIDFILDTAKIAYEVKYRDRMLSKDSKGLDAFSKIYELFTIKVLYISNWFDEMLGLK